MGAALVHDVGVDLVAARETYSPNCADEVWLEGKINTALENWMVAAQKIAKLGDLDIEKKFTDYQIQFPTFLQLCSDLCDAINTVLEAEPCKQRLALDDNWRLQHQNDQIDQFEDSVVKLLSTAAEAEV